jgi:hypothetical protein
MSTRKVEYLSGTLHWAKVLGEPVPDYDKTGREWTVNLEPSQEATDILTGHKLQDRIKTKKDLTSISLKMKEHRKDGTPNDGIRVYNADNTPWDQSNLIGNGSKAIVKVTIADYGPTKKKGIYPEAIKVTEHVSYVKSDFPAENGMGDFKTA